MCLPDSNYQRFTWVKGFKVFRPPILSLFLPPKLETTSRTIAKREAAKRHRSQPVFSALKAQDDPKRNETLVYKRTDRGVVVVGDINIANRKLIRPKYPTNINLIVEAA